MNPSASDQSDQPQALPNEVQIQTAGLPRQEDKRFTQLDSNGQPIVTGEAPAQPVISDFIPLEQVVDPADIPIPQPPAAYVPESMPAPNQPAALAPQPTYQVPPTQQSQAQYIAPTPPMPTQPASISGGAGPKAAVKPPQAHPNSTQNSLQIAEVRDGIVIMNDGSFRSVVMAKSINFDLMSPQEQEGVEYAYQGFLNSLYFPIQIFVRSEKVDLRPYIEKLDKIRTEHDNMLLALLMEDYIGYIDSLSQQTNIMDKHFYLVIPFFPSVDVQKGIEQSKNFLAGLGGVFKPKENHVTINENELENAKTELRNRVQAVLGGLAPCGIQGLPLDTQELIELYYDTYNPDTATRQELKNFDNLTADIITKGQGVASQAHLQREMH